MNSKRKRAKLVFQCPEDFGLLELSNLTYNFSRIYIKLELTREGRRFKSTYPGLPTPKETLVLKQLKYGSDLYVVIEGAGVVIGALLLVFHLMDGKEKLQNWREERAIRREFREMLEKTADSNLWKEVENIAKEFEMTVDQLLQMLDEELRHLFESRVKVQAKFAGIY